MFNPRKTSVRRVSAAQPEAGVIAEAAAILQRGGLLAFPTETVYGLGANALSATAVESIFTAKGRPANNPVIVHVANAAAAMLLTTDWPERAAQLAAHFWPGSLTLVLPKRPMVPEIVTAGGPTVAVRVPAHPVALALLQAARIPIAAPSANRSTAISPTTAEHVLRGLDGRVDLILDGGPAPGGLESTVLDLTVEPPQLLRPGLVTVEQLKAVIGEVVVDEKFSAQSLMNPSAGSSAAGEFRTAASEPVRSPGMQERHYAPRAKLKLVSVEGERVVAELLTQGGSVGWLKLTPGGPRIAQGLGKLHVIEMPEESAGYSARLYAALHELDDMNVETIVVDSPPVGDAWLAVHDRLRRAAQAE